MTLSIQVATLWQRVKHTGLMLVFIGVLTLLLLLALVGAVISHASQGAVPHAVPHGGLMAPTPVGGGGGDSGPTSIAATNGTVRIGG